MRIVACVKPVPDPRQWEKITVDPRSGTLNRAGVPSVISVLDRQALEVALRLKETRGGRVTVLAMAPPETASTLRQALAMGADEAYLLSDKAFAGADTLATARVLARGIDRLGGADLVLCGDQSPDGATSQVPPQLAQLLGLPCLSHVVGLEFSGTGELVAQVDLGRTRVTARAGLPLLIATARGVCTPRYVSTMGILAARNRPLVTWDHADLGLAPDDVGLAGSPTRPLRVYAAERRHRRAQMVEGSPAEVAARILEILGGTKG